MNATFLEYRWKALLWQELIDRSIKPESPKAIIGDIVNIFFRTVQ